jgi:hypothetical protein
MAAEVGFDPYQPTAASGAEIITLQCSVSFPPNPAVHANRLEGPLWGNAAIVS